MAIVALIIHAHAQMQTHVCEHVSSAFSYRCSSLFILQLLLSPNREKQPVWRQKTGDARHLFSCKQTHTRSLFLNREAFREQCLGWKNSKEKLYQPVHRFSSIKTATELMSLFDTTYGGPEKSFNPEVDRGYLCSSI